MNYDQMSIRIAAKIENPALWMLELRRIGTELRLNVRRCLPLAPESLQIACQSLLDEAGKQGRTDAEILRAVD